MINLKLTVREAIKMASNANCGGDLYERIVEAIEASLGLAKHVVVCNGVSFNGEYWDKKIAAIKYVRTATGWGLKESKEWVEGCQHGSRNNYTPALDINIATKLREDLESCGCSCWTIPA